MGVATNRPHNAISTARLSAETRSIIHLGQSSTLTQKQCFGEIVPRSYRLDCVPLLKTGFMVNDLTEFGSPGPGKSRRRRFRAARLRRRHGGLGADSGERADTLKFEDVGDRAIKHLTCLSHPVMITRLDFLSRSSASRRVPKKLSLAVLLIASSHARRSSAAKICQPPVPGSSTSPGGPSCCTQTTNPL